MTAFYTNLQRIQIDLTAAPKRNSRKSKTKDYVTSPFAFDQNIDSAIRCIHAKIEK